MSPEAMAQLLHHNWPGCRPAHTILPYIIENLDLVIESYSLPDKFSGAPIQRVDNGKIYIAVNKYHAKNRNLFTLAHEIGHIICGPSEWAANAFAGALLMPADQVESLRKEGRSIDYMAQYFQVSKDAVIVRLQVLTEYALLSAVT